MNCQPGLDASGQHCAYAYRDAQRPHCELTPAVRYANMTLCADCATRRSSLGKGETGQHLAPGRPPDLLAWVSEADERLARAHAELAAAVRRTRTRGHSWAAIGAALNISRQAAQQRFGQDPLPKG
jgi:hypothetical protein